MASTPQAQPSKKCTNNLARQSHCGPGCPFDDFLYHRAQQRLGKQERQSPQTAHEVVCDARLGHRLSRQTFYG